MFMSISKGGFEGHKLERTTALRPVLLGRFIQLESQSSKCERVWNKTLCFTLVLLGTADKNVNANILC